MARKRSKERRAKRARRRRKALDDLIGRHVVEALLVGTESPDDAVADLSTPERHRAISLIRELRGDVEM